MKSSIKIDFIDRGTGIGIEPVIRIELIKSEDPRDTLFQVLYESLRGQSFLQLQVADCRQIATPEGLPDLERRIYLFKPERNTDEVISALHTCCLEWIYAQGWKMSETPPQQGYPNNYEKKKVIRGYNELFSDFLSIKATHQN